MILTTIKRLPHGFTVVPHVELCALLPGSTDTLVLAFSNALLASKNAADRSRRSRCSIGKKCRRRCFAATVSRRRSLRAFVWCRRFTSVRNVSLLASCRSNLQNGAPAYGATTRLDGTRCSVEEKYGSPSLIRTTCTVCAQCNLSAWRKKKWGVDVSAYLIPHIGDRQNSNLNRSGFFLNSNILEQKAETFDLRHCA